MFNRKQKSKKERNMYNDNNHEDYRSLDADRLERLFEQQDVLQKELDEREVELRKVKDRIKALQTLLSDDDDAEPKLEHTVAETPANRTTTAPLEVAYRVLKEQSPADMHYKRITDEVLKRGGDLRGSNPSALLNTLLTSDKSKRFVRPFRRGCYALREDHPNLKRSVGERQSRLPDVG